MSLTTTSSCLLQTSRSAVAFSAVPSFNRDALVNAHLSKVRYIADRMATKLPPSIEREDLYGAGVIGLLDAVERFDPTRGVAFTTFAEMRVRGAILDSLRALDWASRSMRRRAREVQVAYSNVEKEKGRPATEEEVAAHLKMPLSNLHEILNELRQLSITTFDLDGDEDECNISEKIFDTGRSPLEQYEEVERRERLAKAIDKLAERERQVLALYYVEELTMKEIGEVIGVTESRVSQLRTQAIAKLRGTFSF